MCWATRSTFAALTGAGRGPFAMPKSDTDATFSQPRRSDENAETGGNPEILDWDVCLETPPPRPAGRIKVRLNFLGRGKPTPLPEPECPDQDASREVR